MRKSTLFIGAIVAATIFGNLACTAPTEDTGSTSDAIVSPLEINVARADMLAARDAVAAIDARGRAELAAVGPALEPIQQHKYSAAFMTNKDFAPAVDAWSKKADALAAALAKIDWTSHDFTLRTNDNESLFALILSDYAELSQSPHPDGAIAFMKKLAKDAKLRGELEKALDTFKADKYLTQIKGLENLASAKNGADALRQVRGLITAKATPTEFLRKLYASTDPAPALDEVTSDLTAAWNDNTNVVKGIAATRDLIRSGRFTQTSLEQALKDAGLVATQDVLVFRGMRALGMSYAMWQAQNGQYAAAFLTFMNNGPDAVAATGELLRSFRLATTVKPVDVLGKALVDFGKATGSWGNILSTLATTNLAQDDKVMVAGQAIYLLGAILELTPAAPIATVLEGVGVAVQFLASVGEGRAAEAQWESEIEQYLGAAGADPNIVPILASMGARHQTGAIEALGAAHVSPADVRWLITSSHDVYDGNLADGVVAIGNAFAMNDDEKVGAFLHAIVAGETDRNRIDAGFHRFLSTVGPIQQTTKAPRSSFESVLDAAIDGLHTGWQPGELEGIQRADAYLKKAP